MQFKHSLSSHFTLRSASVGAWFAATLIGLNFSVELRASATSFQTQQTLSVPADSTRWELQGQAKATEYQGRNCLFLDGGVAVLKDLEMRDGIVDVDVATSASRGFFGIQFRIASDGGNAEWVWMWEYAGP